jgi:hypothetical protein
MAHLSIAYSEASLTAKKTMKWIKCNNQGVGFYRVSYSSQLFKMLLSAIDEHPAGFDILDRASFLGDTFALTWYILELRG